MLEFFAREHPAFVHLPLGMVAGLPLPLLAALWSRHPQGWKLTALLMAALACLGSGVALVSGLLWGRQIALIAPGALLPVVASEKQVLQRVLRLHEGAALAGFVLGLLCLLPGIPAVGWPGLPAWAGLLAGTALALTLGNPHAARTRKATPMLLAWSVVGLGAAMNLNVVARVGLQGFGYTAVGITVALLLGVGLGRLLQVRRTAALLTSAGTAICGGSAIAALAPVLQADEEDTSVALGTVFLLNAAALLVFPAIGHALHLGERAFGLWAALAIHDTSSVVGASAGYGPEALLVATTTRRTA